MLKTFNGWTTLSSCPPATFVAPNGKTVYVRDDDVAAVFAYVTQRWHREIEPLPKATHNTWPKERMGFVVIHGYRPSNTKVGTGSRSNHCSGTAIDINGHLHPYEATLPAAQRGGGYRDGFTKSQRDTLRDIADSVVDKSGKSIIRLGIDFAVGKRDGMHVEIAPGVTLSRVRQAADALRESNNNSGAPSGLRGKKPKGIRASRATGKRAPKLTTVVQHRVRAMVPQEVDGAFGAKTEAGVKALQKKVGVTVDGKVGPVTVRADLASRGTVRTGDSGPVVRWVQYIVGVDADGKFGEQTERAVKQCQKGCGLTPDGVFGPDCRERLVIAP
jgi:peptidoglycan hydrolase-like protein with peptidoglycan-binding domain